MGDIEDFENAVRACLSLSGGEHGAAGLVVLLSVAMGALLGMNNKLPSLSADYLEAIEKIRTLALGFERLIPADEANVFHAVLSAIEAGEWRQ